MDIIITDAAVIRNNDERRGETTRTPRSSYRRDRRKIRTDRRRSIRDGISVSFSFKKERRSGFDRRSQSS
jgi:hypothetical protein